jgi:hypothetical protein
VSGSPVSVVNRVTVIDRSPPDPGDPPAPADTATPLTNAAHATATNRDVQRIVSAPQLGLTRHRKHFTERT